MTKEELFKKYGEVTAKFYRFDNYTAYYRASILNGTQLEVALYSADIASYSFDVKDDIKISEPTPHNVLFMLTEPGKEMIIIE